MRLSGFDLVWFDSGLFGCLCGLTFDFVGLMILVVFEFAALKCGCVLGGIR